MSLDRDCGTVCFVFDLLDCGDMLIICMAIGYGNWVCMALALSHDSHLPYKYEEVGGPYFFSSSFEYFLI